MITIVINPNFAVVGVNVELFTEFVICEIWVLSALCFTMIAFLWFLCFLSKSGSFFSFIEMMDLQEETGEVKIEDQCVENKQSTPASCSSVSEGSAGSSHKLPTIASPATVSPTHRYLGLVRLLLLLPCFVSPPQHSFANLHLFYKRLMLIVFGMQEDEWPYKASQRWVDSGRG